MKALSLFFHVGICSHIDSELLVQRALHWEGHLSLAHQLILPVISLLERVELLYAWHKLAVSIDSVSEEIVNYHVTARTEETSCSCLSFTQLSLRGSRLCQYPFCLFYSFLHSYIFLYKSALSCLPFSILFSSALSFLVTQPALWLCASQLPW